MTPSKIHITDFIGLDADELEFTFIRASGPGGQNVNKVSSAVQLRFDVAHSPNLDDALKARILSRAGQRATRDGVVVIEAKRHRTQIRNKQDAIERLVTLIEGAMRVNKPRRKSRPTKASKERRLASKKKRSQTKDMRRGPRRDD